jgi:membrane protein required for colicin V production
VNTIDIILAIALGFGFFKGFFKGFIVEVASLGALFLGLLGAVKFSDIFANLLNEFFHWSPLAVQTTSYLIIFIIIVYGLSVLAKTMTKIISKASLGLLNKFLGAFFGAFKWAIFMSVALFFLEKLNTWITIINTEMIESSILYEPITELGEYLFNWGSEFSKEVPRDLI